ncbi:YuzF family protein [Paenibacillus sp. CAA11]|uniref:YuzF family protein n=1 Tax=Paenibacillus sp. CAA11 TaxID=1532905 RepID=UPI0019017A9B|nr:YuzF family protein [Paenibacillus sp. CAA11]
MPYPVHPYHHATKPLSVTLIDPCVVEALRGALGKYVVLETTRGRLEGCVADVKPDHVVLDVRGKMFFVRICEIVWIMPD